MSQRPMTGGLAAAREAETRPAFGIVARRAAITASLLLLFAPSAFARQGRTLLRITDSQTGKIIDGATFTISGPNGFAYEGTISFEDTFDGVEVFGSLPPGDYVLRARALTYRDGELRFTIDELPDIPDYLPTDRLRISLTRQRPVAIGVVDHRIASGQTTVTDENSLLGISGVISPQQAATIRELLAAADVELADLSAPTPAPTLTFLDRTTAFRQRFSRTHFEDANTVAIPASGNLSTDAVVTGSALSDEAWNTIFGLGPNVGLARARYDENGELSDFETEPLGAGFGPTPIPLDRDGEPRLIYYDDAARRWVELDLEGDSQVPGGFDRTPGSQLGENTGGLEPQAASALDGNGTVTFSSRSSSSIPAGFNCIGGTSTQQFTRFGSAGQIADDAAIPGASFPTQIGQSCFPPHTTETSDFEFGGRWGVSFQAGAEILLATTSRSLDPGTETDRLYELASLPSELDGIFFWRPAVLGDADNGSYLIDVPNGPSFEGSEDGERLGFAPWPITNEAFDLPLVSSGQLLRHALTVDVSGGPWRIGTFERRLLDGSAPAGERVVAEVPLPGCLDTRRTLCLADNRFAVTASFQTKGEEEGDGQARSLSNGSGTFWFFEPENRELIVKVLPACGVNGHYWFFAAGLTDVGVELLLTDPETGIANLYTNPVGRPFEPILDTQAFACSEVDGDGAGRPLADAGISASSAERLDEAASSGGEACGGDAADLCLAGDRFRVEVDYTDFAGATSPAFGGNLTPDTGALFFFDPSNVEMLVKVLDACVFGNYWLFAAGLTNLEVDLKVTDTVTGVSREYRNRVGESFQPISDTASFPCS